MIRPCNERGGLDGAMTAVDSCKQAKTASCKVAPIDIVPIIGICIIVSMWVAILFHYAY